MLTVDTTVVVRLVTNDDPKQARRAAALFSTRQVRVPLTVLLETEWVLRYAYGLKTDAIAKSLRGLLGLPNVTLVQPREVHHALQLYDLGFDFADALNLATATGTKGFKTFDERLFERAQRAGVHGIALL